MKSFLGGKISTCECIAKRFSDASGCCRIIVGADWTFRGRFRLHSSLPYQITENISQPFSCISLHAKSILHALLQFDFQRKYIVYSGLPHKNGKIWLPTIFKHCMKRIVRIPLWSLALRNQMWTKHTSFPSACAKEEESVTYRKKLISHNRNNRASWYCFHTNVLSFCIYCAYIP